jgi:outer membrane protein
LGVLKSKITKNVDSILAKSLSLQTFYLIKHKKMKNTSLIWNAILTVAVGVLFFLHFKSTSPTASTTSGSSKSIVYVNTDSLLANYDYFKDAMKELENKRFRLETDLNAKGKSLQNEAAFFQQKAQQGNMSEDQARTTQQQLVKKEQDLIAYRDNASRALSVEEAKKQEELLNKIQDFLKNSNKQNNYDIVLGYSKGGGVLFANTNLEITKKVIEGLNKEYADTKPKK